MKPPSTSDFRLILPSDKCYWTPILHLGLGECPKCRRQISLRMSPRLPLLNCSLGRKRHLGCTRHRDSLCDRFDGDQGLDYEVGGAGDGLIGEEVDDVDLGGVL